MRISIIISSVIISLTAFSCNSQISNNIQLDTEIFAKSETSLKYQFVKSESISEDIIENSLKYAQEVADKASKRRQIDFFNLPDNPFGLKISSQNSDAFILNYIGTSREKVDLNIEMRLFYSEPEMLYIFNYSGPVTKAEITEKSPSLKVKKNNKISFELITGLPQEYIVRTFESFVKENVNSYLKKLYRHKELKISEDIYVFAIYKDKKLDSFFFESHNNQLILGERKYADLQIGVVISLQNEIKASYLINAFNPKTTLNKPPEYQYNKIDNTDIIQLGTL